MDFSSCVNRIDIYKSGHILWFPFSDCLQMQIAFHIHDTKCVMYLQWKMEDCELKYILKAIKEQSEKALGNTLLLLFDKVKSGSHIY